jgi:hypothetical protein
VVVLAAVGAVVVPRLVNYGYVSPFSDAAPAAAERLLVALPVPAGAERDATATDRGTPTPYGVTSSVAPADLLAKVGLLAGPGGGGDGPGAVLRRPGWQASGTGAGADLQLAAGGDTTGSSAYAVVADASPEPGAPLGEWVRARRPAGPPPGHRALRGGGGRRLRGVPRAANR